MVKQKETECNETQTILFQQDSIKYIVLATSQTPNITYGDCFAIQIKYCITWVTKDSCKLVISVGLKWFKSTMVKSIIRSAAIKGLQDSITDLIEILKNEIDPIKPISLIISEDEKKNEVPSTKSPRNKKKNVASSTNWISLIFTGNFYTTSLFLICIVAVYRYSKTTKQSTIHESSSISYKISSKGQVDWANELLSQQDVVYQSTLAKFIQIHFQVPESKTTEFLSTRNNSLIDLSSLNSTPRNALLSYSSPNNLGIYSRLVKVHQEAQESRIGLVKASQYIDQVEKKVVITELVNWVSDRAQQCREFEESVLLFEGISCKEIQRVFRSLLK